MTSTPPPPEQRTFTLHPAIIKTMIHEQAASLDTAMSELVMNAIDAGASRIDLTINADGEFVFADNGRGFRSRREIDQFFETFGTPHQAGDAKYGRFRIGRGQIFSYAATVWRSGLFEMRVDLEQSAETFGYQLLQHDASHEGCRISGRLYHCSCYLMEVFEGGDLEGYGVRGSFSRLIRYVPVPVFVNGQQVNQLPSEQAWDHEDDNAWYRFDRDSRVLDVYNAGVFVMERDAHDHGTGGVVVSKQALLVDMTRNSIITHKCPTWAGIAATLRERFTLRLSRLKKLTDNEASAFLQDLLFTPLQIPPQQHQRVMTLRFLPDVFGDLRSPSDMLTAKCFTLFDGQHTAIGERVQREGLATVIMPQLLRLGKASVTEDNTVKVVARLRNRLHLTGQFELIPFSHFVQQLSDTSTLLADAVLDPEERLVLQTLRQLNCHLAWIAMGNSAKARELVAGTSDLYSAWTDAKTYIAIHRSQLKGIRGKGYGGGAARLMMLLAHEYGHEEHSLGDHHHDLEFYNRYHRITMHWEFGLLIDRLFRRYIAGMVRLQRVPSSDHRAHLTQLTKAAQSLPRRGQVRSLGRPPVLTSDHEDTAHVV